MESIIKKAIEGGWRGEHVYLNPVSDTWHFNNACDDTIVVLDPLFFQALGKSCGWTRTFCKSSYGCNGGEGEYRFEYDGNKEEDFSEEVIIHEWEYRALRFHEINLTQSWDSAIEYLISVTTIK